MVDATDMSTPVTRGELRKELAHLATKAELEIWGGALLARLMARIESGEQRVMAYIDGSEQRVLQGSLRISPSDRYSSTRTDFSEFV